MAATAHTDVGTDRVEAKLRTTKDHKPGHQLLRCLGEPVLDGGAAETGGACLEPLFFADKDCNGPGDLVGGGKEMCTVADRLSGEAECANEVAATLREDGSGRFNRSV